MTPLNGIIYGLLFSTSARIANGEVDLSEEMIDRLESARDQLDGLSHLIGDLSPARPGTWSSFAGRLMERSFHTRCRYDSPGQALQALGFDARRQLPAALVETIADDLGRHSPENGQSHSLYRDDDVELLLLLDDANSPTICAEFCADRQDSARIYYRSEEIRPDQVQELLSALLWQSHRALYLGTTRGYLDLGDLDLSDFIYHGERLALIDEWRAFKAQDIRRNVLLQGPPGCGKTTLCGHAARQLGERIAFVAPELLSQSSLAEWTDLIEILNPEVLIVDDIDRLGDLRSSSLEDKLAFFEEGHCQIPIVLFTSNDYTRIPAAMRRPGRIDQVVRFEEPDEQVRKKIIAELATREGIEIPDEEWPRLLTLLDDYSPAHVLEALRRAQVCGWAHSRRDDDAFRLQRDYHSAPDWLRIHGYREQQIEATFIFTEIAARADLEIAFEDDRGKLFRAALPNGASICFEPHDRWGIGSIYYRHDIDGLQAFRQGVAQLFWKERPAVLIDAVEHDHQSCQAVDLSPHDYYGPLTECIEHWQTFADQGYRRNILLQGPPGCGKSTFCMHAARQLSERTLMLTPEYCGSLRCGTWKNIIQYLDPQMVIIDDVDRVSDHSLETNLRLFEEGFCEVPFVFFTTNDHHKLPRPMRRPGRIDQIIEVEPPTQELRWQLIDEMASREGLDQIPDDHLRRLDHILLHQSTAHLVEALRRARVLGWQQVFCTAPGDTTFADAADQDLNAPMDQTG